MAVESASYISQLNTSNPAASDNISEGDDHLRLIKTVLQTQFPNLSTTAVTQTSAQMNKLGHETGSVVMFASNLMAEKQYDIKQYILEGLVCVENNKYTLYDYNPYENFIDDLSFKNRGREFKQEYRENSQTNFNKELNKFANKI